MRGSSLTSHDVALTRSAVAHQTRSPRIFVALTRERPNVFPISSITEEFLAKENERVKIGEKEDKTNGSIVKRNYEPFDNVGFAK